MADEDARIDQSGTDQQGFQPSQVPPTRICPSCATQAQTAGDFCPHCGKSYARRRLSRGAVIVGVCVAMLAVAATGGGIAVKVSYDQRVAREAAARQDAVQRAEEEAGQREAAKAEAERQAVISGRRALEKALAAAITKTAREYVREGTLEGPIYYTSLNPVAGGSEDLAEPTAKYEGLAVNKKDKDGTVWGYSFDGTINFDKGTYTWVLQR